MSDGWLYLEHEVTGGATRIPDDPNVLAAQQARGWRLVDEPAPPLGLPAKVNLDPAAAGAEWVELVHPLLGATHSFPNDPVAIAGAGEAGWVAPNKDGSVPKRALQRAAKDAGVDPADLPDPQADPAAPEELAGDTADEEPNESAGSSATNENEKE